MYAKNKNSLHSTLSRAVLFCFLHATTSSVIYYSTDTWTIQNMLKKFFISATFSYLIPLYFFLTVTGMADGQITIVPRRQEPQVGLLVNVGPDEPERKVCSTLLLIYLCFIFQWLKLILTIWNHCKLKGLKHP